MTEALADMAITAGLPRRQKRRPKNKVGKDQLDLFPASSGAPKASRNSKTVHERRRMLLGHDVGDRHGEAREGDARDWRDEYGEGREGDGRDSMPPAVAGEASGADQPAPFPSSPEAPDKQLTEPIPELARLIKATPAGMAHWAGTGPSGATCGACMFYEYFDNKMKRVPNRCLLFHLSTKTHCKTPISEITPACKYFGTLPDA
jgi:hypothetical protein